MFPRLMLAAMLVATPVAAQDVLPPETVVAEGHEALAGEVVGDCLAEGRGAACIGTGAAACLAADVAPGAGICAAAEMEVWSGYLAEAEGALARMDALAGQEMSLVDVAQAFDTYRTLACEAAGAAWPGMSGSGVAWAECRMRVTAEHALRLMAWVEALE